MGPNRMGPIGMGAQMGRAQLKGPNGAGPNGYSGGPKWDGPNWNVTGYMVHTTKDRSIVITKPNGAILCSCPVQPNNTWIFPHQLMTGNPSTAASTGISGVPGTIVLPFRIPHGEPRHFTKEEVKRATQARDLHCFLGHL